MKFISIITLFALASPLAAIAATKTYQVTGPVLEVTPSSVVIQKGKEKWEIQKDASTKGADIKKGDKVTITYTMSATTIAVKAPSEGGRTKTE